MEKAKGHYDAHVFVCTFGKKCGPCGGEELQQELKAWMKSKPEWNGRIRINKAGCLDRCDNPIAVAIYPQNEFLLECDVDNIDELKARITELMEKKS